MTKRVFFYLITSGIIVVLSTAVLKVFDYEYKYSNAWVPLCLIWGLLIFME